MSFRISTVHFGGTRGKVLDDPVSKLYESIPERAKKCIPNTSTAKKIDTIVITFFLSFSFKISFLQSQTLY